MFHTTNPELAWGRIDLESHASPGHELEAAYRAIGQGTRILDRDNFMDPNCPSAGADEFAVPF
jgi:hypothetical protein